MSFLPRLFRSTPSFASSASSALPIASSSLTATAGPSRIRTFSTTPVVEKMRTVQAAVFRFKYKKSTNEWLRRQAGVRHGNTMWSVGHLKRLRGPVAIKTKNQKKMIQRMLPYGN